MVSTKGIPALIAVVLLTSATSSAWAREEGAPASALGLSDAVRAAATGTSGLFFNPAGMGLISQYAVEAGYTFAPNLDGHSFGAYAVDSRTNQALAFGSGYNYILSEEVGLDPEGNPIKRSRDGHQVRAGIASGWDWESFGFRAGVGVRYQNLTVGWEDNPDNGQHDDVEFFTLDAGLVFDIVRMFRIAVTAHNLIDTGANARASAPRSIGLGAAALFDAFQISFDVDLDIMSKSGGVVPSYFAGAQYLIAGMVVARAGFGYRGIDADKSLSAGVGYVSETIAADVSFSKSLDNADEAIVSASVRYFLP